MKSQFLVLATLFLCTLVTGGQGGRPVPPGIREADKVTNRADVPPQVTAKRQPADSTQFQRDAQELASLAQLIPSEVEQVKIGRLPKDLEGQLKRIEKLSKQLRRELSRQSRFFAALWQAWAGCPPRGQNPSGGGPRAATRAAPASRSFHSFPPKVGRQKQKAMARKPWLLEID